jgi:hypothetical protein
MEVFPYLPFTFLFMKSAMISVLISGLTLVSGVSAMEMMDSGAMMKYDDKMMMSDSMDKTMMKDTMMKEDAMMMKDDAKMMAKKSTAAVATSMGYTWSKDRAKLAEMAGVVGYRGTMKQNLAIRTYLMGMMKDKMMMAK